MMDEVTREEDKGMRAYEGHQPLAGKKRGQEHATKGATLFYIFYLSKERLAYVHKAYHFPVSTEESRLQMGLEMYQRLPEGADYPISRDHFQLTNVFSVWLD